MPTFFRMIASAEAVPWDFLSQDARRQPPPRNDSDFLELWRGMSVEETYEGARAKAARLRPPWKHGEYIAMLEIPDSAPFTYKRHGHTGHWLVYGAAGDTILEADARILCTYVVRVVHGPSVLLLSSGS